MVSTIGSCACFCLSLLIGKAVAQALWPERLEAFADEVRAITNSLYISGVCKRALLDAQSSSKLVCGKAAVPESGGALACTGQLQRGCPVCLLMVSLEQVRKRQGDLLNYIVFLRVTPLLPNTFINVCAPIVRVPLPHFALGAHLRCC